MKKVSVRILVSFVFLISILCMFSLNVIGANTCGDLTKTIPTCREINKNINLGTINLNEVIAVAITEVDDNVSVIYDSVYRGSACITGSCTPVVPRTISFTANTAGPRVLKLKLVDDAWGQNFINARISVAGVQKAIWNDCWWQGSASCTTEIRGISTGDPIGKIYTNIINYGFCVKGTEVCNGIDDDCDGSIDQGLNCNCGNGVLDDGEECDVSAIGCTNCKKDPGVDHCNPALSCCTPYSSGISVFANITSPINNTNYYDGNVKFNASQSYVLNCSVGCPLGKVCSIQSCDMNCFYVHNANTYSTSGYTLALNWSINDYQILVGDWNDNSHIAFESFFNTPGDYLAKLKLIYSQGAVSSAPVNNPSANFVVSGGWACDYNSTNAFWERLGVYTNAFNSCDLHNSTLIPSCCPTNNLCNTSSKKCYVSPATSCSALTTQGDCIANARETQLFTDYGGCDPCERTDCTCIWSGGSCTFGFTPIDSCLPDSVCLVSPCTPPNPDPSCVGSPTCLPDPVCLVPPCPPNPFVCTNPPCGPDPVCTNPPCDTTPDPTPGPTPGPGPNPCVSNCGGGDETSGGGTPSPGCVLESSTVEDNCESRNTYKTIGYYGPVCGQINKTSSCASIARLPFFGGVQFVISLIAIALIYAIILKIKK